MIFQNRFIEGDSCIRDSVTCDTVVKETLSASKTSEITVTIIGTNGD